jgi:preprotein translocase subunit SecD
MADRKIDFRSLTVVDYAMGAAFAIMGTAIVSGFAVTMGIDLPGVVASLLGAAIGAAAWLYYLLKRNTDDAR